MSKKLIFSALFIGIFFAATLHAAEVIDRIVATVNGHILLQSEVDEDVRFQALANGRPLRSITVEDRKAALDRLIDQELIREEVHSSDFQAATPAEVDARTVEIRKLHTEAADEVSWQLALRRYGLDEKDLRDKISADLNSWKAVEARLRPNVAIDSRSIERYYQENLLPELHKQGAAEVPLAEVAPRIKEVLSQQQINDLLGAWLKSLRTESNIQIAYVPGIDSSGGSE